MAVAARRLITQGKATKVLIFDLDVHQGDGTASIFAADPNVFTVSIHCEDNFPFKKEKSDLDVGLIAGKFYVRLAFGSNIIILFSFHWTITDN